jgi:hypothetical protein
MEVKESEHLSKADVKPNNILYDDNQISNCFPRNTSTITLRDAINIEPGGISETQPEVCNVPVCRQRMRKPVEVVEGSEGPPQKKKDPDGGNQTLQN